MENGILQLIVNGVKIKRIEYANFLGSYIYKKSTLSVHMNIILNKLRQRLYFFNSVKNVSWLPTIEKLLYNAHFYYYINYGIVTWGSMTSSSLINKASRLQDKFIKTRQNTLMQRN